MAVNDNLRVTFIAGGLGKGGAEKQFLYMLRALKEIGAAVQVLTVTAGEFHESSLTDLGIQPIYLGSNPAVRIANILKAAASFRPHFLQASHFFAGFYAGLAGRLAGIPSIGAIRSDLYRDLQGVPRLGEWAIRMPSVLLTNSFNGRDNALAYGIQPERLFILLNGIDLEDFDRHSVMPPNPPLPGSRRIRAVTIARLVPVKRLERFLVALSIARRQVPELEGLIIGSGPEENTLRVIASDLALISISQAGLSAVTDPLRSGVRFLGERGDIAEILGQSDICVLTSDREGFPNVLLEAMAARLPLLSTPAGEARHIVQQGINGYQIPFDDIDTLAAHLVMLARSPETRHSIGQAGRMIVENHYSYTHFKDNLMETYRAIARQQNNQKALAALQNRSVFREAVGSIHHDQKNEAPHHPNGKGANDKSASYKEGSLQTKQPTQLSLDEALASRSTARTHNQNEDAKFREG